VRVSGNTKATTTIYHHPSRPKINNVKDTTLTIFLIMIFYIILFKKTISKFYSYLTNDSLYRNSIYLILSMGVVSVFGFFFWMINARLYSAEQVGIGTTLISLMSLISSFSFLGLGNNLIKYLPTSDKKK